MKIKWFGHSFFLITSLNGTKIATDPFNEKVGYEIPDVTADIVTVSHNHYDHNKTEVIKGKYECFNKEGYYVSNNIEIRSILSSHGKLRGKNLIFIFNIDGIVVCHCGDLGEILKENQLKRIGKVDVLMLPVGGGFQVLDTKPAIKVMEQIKPQVIIPIHYKTLKTNIGFIMANTVDKFTKECHGKYINSNEIEINKESIENYKGVIVLKYE